MWPPVKMSLTSLNSTIHQVACMEVSIYFHTGESYRDFFCSGPCAKWVAACESESEQHAQTLNVFLLESKEVHQALCLFFNIGSAKLRTMFFSYTIFQVLQS